MAANCRRGFGLLLPHKSRRRRRRHRNAPLKRGKSFRVNAELTPHADAWSRLGAGVRRPEFRIHAEASGSFSDPPRRGWVEKRRVFVQPDLSAVALSLSKGEGGSPRF